MTGAALVGIRRSQSVARSGKQYMLLLVDLQSQVLGAKIIRDLRPLIDPRATEQSMSSFWSRIAPFTAKSPRNTRLTRRRMKKPSVLSPVFDTSRIDLSTHSLASSSAANLCLGVFYIPK